MALDYTGSDLQATSIMHLPCTQKRGDTSGFVGERQRGPRTGGGNRQLPIGWLRLLPVLASAGSDIGCADANSQGRRLP